jgi:uncharacterized DUF497 family protein
VEITFDPSKNARNISERQLPFTRAAEIKWESAVFKEDVRKNYPERRYIAIAYLDKRLHVLCFSETDLGIRVISFRKANQREGPEYEEKITTN